MTEAQRTWLMRLNGEVVTTDLVPAHHVSPGGVSEALDVLTSSCFERSRAFLEQMVSEK